jgi:hypothetical protein
VFSLGGGVSLDCVRPFELRIASENGWIDAAQLQHLVEALGKSTGGEYLRRVTNNDLKS